MRAAQDAVRDIWKWLTTPTRHSRLTMTLYGLACGFFGALSYWWFA